MSDFTDVNVAHWTTDTDQSMYDSDDLVPVVNPATVDEDQEVPVFVVPDDLSNDFGSINNILGQHFGGPAQLRHWVGEGSSDRSLLDNPVVDAIIRPVDHEQVPSELWEFSELSMDLRRFIHHWQQTQPPPSSSPPQPPPSPQVAHNGENMIHQ